MKKLLILLFAWPLMAVDCRKEEGPNCHYNIVFRNNSADSVVRATIVPRDNLCYLNGPVVPPFSNDTIKYFRICIEGDITNHGPQNIYIVDRKKYNDQIYYNCDSIEVKNKVLKHYSLTVEYLRENGFTINYP
jgi:hypothetical protein